VAPDGTVDALDAQPEMLAVLRGCAAAAGVSNIADAVGDAQRLPFAKASFDAVYLIGVLGETPDPVRALREFHRVLTPAGRLVIGEALIGDPDAVRLSVLRSMTEEAGFAFERRLGPSIAYFARCANKR
jgi:ubiquinone/menaquinone biosynthesis C-methylase UbiE